MVGEGEKSILRSRKEGEGECQNASYSRRKKDKKACKFATDDDDNMNDNVTSTFDHNQLVDRFVQEVIQKAKSEYLSLYANHHSDGDVTTHPLQDERQQDCEKVEDRLLGKSPKKAGKEKSGKDKTRRKHHYKYSDPVDAREISAYDERESNSLLEQGGGGVDTDPGGLYERTVITFRRLLGCCIGKT